MSRAPTLSSSSARLQTPLGEPLGRMNWKVGLQCMMTSCGALSATLIGIGSARSVFVTNKSGPTLRIGVDASAPAVLATSMPTNSSTSTSTSSLALSMPLSSQSTEECYLRLSVAPFMGGPALRIGVDASAPAVLATSMPTNSSTSTSTSSPALSMPLPMPLSFQSTEEYYQRLSVAPFMGGPVLRIGVDASTPTVLATSMPTNSSTSTSTSSPAQLPMPLSSQSTEECYLRLSVTPCMGGPALHIGFSASTPAVLAK